jgi:plasmid stabilization system protein ParE
LKIVISDSALQDLEAIIQYYTEIGIPEVGTNFVCKILDHLETIPSNPEIGRKVPEFSADKIREVQNPPYRVVYLREEKNINLVRVWRSARIMDLSGTPAEREI